MPREPVLTRDRTKYDERRREFRQRRPEHYCPHCTSVLYAEDESCLECGASRPPSDWSLVSEGFDPCLGRILGDRYLVTRFLGVGGTGNVYRAESITILRQFAIKIIDSNREDRSPGAEKIRMRLEREIEALSRLRNPHIVPFYEVLELPGNFLGVVMDYIEGVTLENLVHQTGPLSIERTCLIARQIAIGVHEAHVVGMTHRDLKPENVMIERMPLGDEFAHILDFGIVQLGDDVHVTHGFLGTPLYASPEQAMGQGVDRRSDIYSLGAVLFFMLTGRPPFLGNNSFEVLDAHIRKPAPKLSKVLPERRFPPGTEELVAKMLAKRPEDRPKDLSEVIVQLDTLRAKVAEIVEEPYPKGALDSAEVLALEINQTQPGLPSRVEEEVQPPTTGEMVEAALEPGTTLDSQPGPPKAEILRRTTPSGRFKSPETSPRVPRPTEPSGERMAVTRAGTTNLNLVGPAPTGDPVHCALDPRGTVVLVDRQQRLWVLPRASGQARHVYTAPAKVTALAVTREAALVGRSDGTIEHVGLEGGTPNQPFGTLSGNVISTIDADPEGRLFIVGTRSGRVFQGRGARRKNVLNSIQAGAPVTSVVVNVNADTFAIARSIGQVEIFNVSSPRTAFSSLKSTGAPIRQMAFSLDGHILALVIPDERTVHLHHVFTGHRLVSYVGSTGRLLGVRFTDDNELLGVSTSNEQVFSWDLQSTMVALPR